MVISIHPAATWPAVEMSISQWNDLAEQHGFIVVYPAESGAFFDGFSRGPPVWPGGPHTLGRDVRFISELIDKLETEYNIDPARIYVDGMSNSGGIAFELSCKLSDRIAAVGAVAAAQGLPWDCGDSYPVPTVAFHGTADKFAPYQGGASPIAPQPVCEYSGVEGPCGTAKPMQRRSDRHPNFSELAPSRLYELH